MPKLILLFTLALSLVSCSKNISENSLKVEEGKFFSKRPTSETHFIAVLELESPPLSSNLKENKVDDELASNITTEQENVINELQNLSSDIKVLNKFKLLLNAVAITAPIELKKDIKGIAGVSLVERAKTFPRPKFINNGPVREAKGFSTTSIDFINATKVHKEQNIKGSGVKVGVIDTGVDYTHAQMGGPGTKEAFKNTDPAKDSPLYPNKKVTGGIDLVGTTYNAASPDFSQRVPRPDSNPIDEGGHGTHVAGSVAGLGDGVNTYDGVAPEAEIHAIKVFGAKGSTDDYVVIAALEYSLDPNGDGDTSDKLDVVNLSLGSPYGKATILYSKAVKNLVDAGVVMVASAGNSGHNDYITGSPAASDESLSVAASIDGMEHNWKFDAVQFSLVNEELISEAVEAAFSKPLKEVESLSGKIVFAGDGASDFDQATKDAVKGNVAMIDRGKVTFAEKVGRAQEAGAIAVIVSNNVEGEPFGMGGDGEFDIPAIMISLENADKIKEAMKSKDVTVDFKTEEKIQKPELIDTLTSFSSKGPRSFDSALKPEISAPGSSIVSAAMGKGAEGTKMSGTSMAAPHMAGVMALIKERFPTLTALELKSIAMASAVTISDKENVQYPISQQGSGRVDAYKAVNTKLIAFPSGLSLGMHGVSKSKTIKKELSLKNLSTEKVSATVKLDATVANAISVRLPETIELEAGEEKTISLYVTLKAQASEKQYHENDGWIKFVSGETELARVPFLAVTKNLSEVKSTELKVFASNEADAPGALVSLNLNNSGAHAGAAEIFNFLAKDERKVKPDSNTSTRACDLKAVGSRVIEREGKKVLQFGVKLFSAITNWEACQVAVLIDSDLDGVADQELVGASHDKIPGLPETATFNSFLFDAAKVRDLRSKYEKEYLEADADDKPNEDYTSAILAAEQMGAFGHSSVAFIEAPVESLAKTAIGDLNIRFAVLNEENRNVEMDDFLGDDLKTWRRVNLDSQAFQGIPTSVSLKANSSITLEFEKGELNSQMMILYPQNAYSLKGNTDSEMELLKAAY